MGTSCQDRTFGAELEAPLGPTLEDLMAARGETISFSMVMVGEFSPAVFHPSWFEKMGLLGREECEAAARDNLVVSNDISSFNVAGMEVVISKDRFQVSSDREDLREPVRDLIMGVAQIFYAVPVNALGLNWVTHLITDSEKQWHNFGHLVSPKDLWGRIWPSHAGLTSQSIQLDKPGEHGAINVRIEPSRMVNHGVFINVNDHYSFKEKMSGDELTVFVESKWAVAKQNSLKILADLERELRNAA